MPIADTLLRLAGSQIFYIPKWSAEILEELRRMLVKAGFTERQAGRRIRVMTEMFPDAMLPDGESRAHFIVNAQSVDGFLARQFERDRAAFLNILVEQAMDIQWPLEKLLEKHAPSIRRLCTTI